MNTDNKMNDVYVTSAEEMNSIGITVPEGTKTVPVWETPLGTMVYWVGGEAIEVADQDFWPRPLEGLEGEVLNLTPQAIGVQMEDGSVEHVRPSGMQAWAAEEVVEVPSLLARVACVVSKTYGATTGLPPVGVPVLISTLAASGCAGRPLTFIPDRGPRAIQKDGIVSHCIRLIAA